MTAILNRFLSPATVVACAALVVALGGVSYAASVLPKNSVGTAQLQKKAVTSRKIKKNAVTSAKVKDGSLRAADFKVGQIPAGPQGPKGDPGAQGPKGDTGAAGSPGLSRAETVEASSNHNSNSPKEVTAICPAGKRVIGTGADTEGGLGAPIAVATVRTIGTNAVDVVAFETAATPETWHVTAQAICAKVS